VIVKRYLPGVQFRDGYFSHMNEQIEKRPLTDLCETFAPLRLANVKTQPAMNRSLEVHGQVTPITCLHSVTGLEVIDGFKRLRGSRLLQWSTVQVRLLEMTSWNGKAEMVRLNRLSRTITEIEEARIMASLRRDDGLTKPQIATLLGWEKCRIHRRLSIDESLHEELWRYLDDGVISAGVGRELARLPRNLQMPLFGKILKDRLGQRAVAKLVRWSLVLASVSRFMPHIGGYLSPEVPTPASSRRIWFRRLADLHRWQRLLLAGAIEDTLPETRQDERLLQKAIDTGRKVLFLLQQKLCDDPPPCPLQECVSVDFLDEEVF